jgi:hypothetical protein
MTRVTWSREPSTLVNMAFVSFGIPLALTMLTHSATSSVTDSPTPLGVMENAAMDF